MYQCVLMYGELLNQGLGILYRLVILTGHRGREILNKSLVFVRKEKRQEKMFKKVRIDTGVLILKQPGNSSYF